MYRVVNKVEEKPQLTEHRDLQTERGEAINKQEKGRIYRMA